MSLQDNKKTALKFLDTVAARQVDELDRMTDPGFTWWTQGSLTSSGLYSKAEYLKANLERAAMVSGTMSFAYGDVTAEEDRVAVEVRSHLVLQGGAPYSNTYHYLLGVKDGKVLWAKEYLDTHYVTQLLGEKA